MAVRWGESSIDIFSFVKFRFSWKKRMLDKVINITRFRYSVTGEKWLFFISLSNHYIWKVRRYF